MLRSASSDTPRHINGVGNFLARCVDWVYRLAPWVVIVTLVITGGVFYYVTENLGVNTDTEDILSPDLPFRQSDKRYSQLFPYYEDNLILVIDGDIPEQAWEGTQRLAAKLEQNEALFKRVYLPQANDFFERYGLMYLDLPELEEMADNLAQAQPFLGRLTQDPSLGGLLEMLNELIKAKHEGDTTLELQPILDPISRAIGATLSGQPYTLSWQKLMSADQTAPEERRQFIIVQPRMDFSRLLPAEPAIEAIRAFAQELPPGIQVRITGDAALSHEELESAIEGGKIAGVLAIAMTGILLLIGLRSITLLLATLLTLISGLILTAGFATVAIGYLNLISTAFAVLYIGLGADYAIHFCLRYQRLVHTELNQREALSAAAAEVGTSLVLCAVTTTIGFYAFIPTDFSGVSELGLIAGTGMFISLGLNLGFLPALLRLLPVPPAGPQRASGGIFGFLFQLPLHYKRSILWSSLVLGLGALVLLPQMRFDYNPLNLRDPSSESVSTLRDLIETETTPPWSAVVLTPNISQAQQLAHQLQQLDTVGTVVTVQDFIPERQEEKLALIDELAFLLGPLLGPAELEPQQHGVTLRQFMGTLESYLADPAASPSPAAYELAEQFQQLLNRLKQSDYATQRQWLLTLQRSLLATLPDNLARLRHSLEASSITLNTLPTDLQQRWTTPTGIQRIEIFPQENIDIDKTEDLRHFVQEIHSVAPDATGSLVLTLKSGEAVVAAFQQAFTYALLAITAILLFLLRNLRDAILVLIPLLLAGILLGAAMVILNTPFNFANIIALPLLLGIGVDNGIHMVRRMRQAPPKTGNPLQTSTARGVVFSALVSACSFGNLLVTPHPGMASMGLLLTVGVALTLLCTLLLLPALLMATQSRSDRVLNGENLANEGEAKPIRCG
ncbi:hopanoid biosynthesis associated RND transporter like protein HpnN [Nitrosococcus halophilus Nc 4]|uniref:Hopanoid biosynthesis associated RND transporter like protein HpnN n=1 Tax=Nitrosococcus halophilus (strain Nc4) TaxID=472759 RepID=D5C071_NITHN|nr:MMPL family transporter [Nitrosococcus halophilus]ADE14397.1 hopanoid biosynthesis associated RND transporter like protein HpnN [Nitrosococcus halophilus Nc 4]